MASDKNTLLYDLRAEQRHRTQIKSTKSDIDNYPEPLAILLRTQIEELLFCDLLFNLM